MSSSFWRMKRDPDSITEEERLEWALAFIRDAISSLPDIYPKGSPYHILQNSFNQLNLNSDLQDMFLQYLADYGFLMELSGHDSQACWTELGDSLSTSVVRIMEILAEYYTAKPVKF